LLLLSICRRVVLVDVDGAVAVVVLLTVAVAVDVAVRQTSHLASADYIQ